MLILPAIACNAVTSIVGGVMDTVGAWPLLPVGFALIAVGQIAISMTAASMNIGVVVALTVVVYAGVGLVLSPSQTAGLETLPAAEHPHGTALLNTWNMIAACRFARRCLSVCSRVLLRPPAPLALRRTLPRRLDLQLPCVWRL